jgi:hypothetical protein
VLRPQRPGSRRCRDDIVIVCQLVHADRNIPGLGDDIERTSGHG